MKIKGAVKKILSDGFSDLFIDTPSPRKRSGGFKPTTLGYIYSCQYMSTDTS